MSELLQSLRSLPPARRRALMAVMARRGIDPYRQLPIPRADRTAPLPLSYAQQRMWFLQQLEPRSAAYNISGGFRISGPLDVSALEQSLTAIVRRHEALRTTVAVIGGEPVPHIHPAASVRLPLHDLTSMPQQERTAALDGLLDAAASAPFDLSVGPLLCCDLVKLASVEHVLLLTMHHIVSDAWSVDLLIGELAKLYPAFCNGIASALDEPEIQYADYAVWQRDWLEAGEGERQLEYWKARLGDDPTPLELPLDRPRPAARDFAGGSVPFLIPDDLTGRLHRLAEAHQTTLFGVLLSAFMVLLHRLTGREDLRVGVPVAGRNRAETEGVIGLFVNTLVIRGSVHDRLRFDEVVRHLHDTVLDAQAHQDLPFEQLVEALQPTRSLGHNPLFQVMFNHLRQGALGIRKLGELDIELIERDLRSQKFDLTLTTQETTNGGLRGAFEFAVDVFDSGTIAGLASSFVWLLEQVAADPRRPVWRYGLVGSEVQSQLAAWNATEAAVAGPLRLHRQIEAQAHAAPDATALECGAERLSYRELNARANRLAYRLRAAGVGRDTLVAVCAERSVALVVALLAILKAGGAYVPLDPDYPAARLEFMLADSGAALLLTQEHLLERLPETAAQVICLDHDAEAFAAYPDTEPEDHGSGEHLAYCIYTSGTTGRPKGAGNTHAALCNRLHWMQREYRLTAADRVLQKTPFGFDVSVWEFFWPLMAGATLVMAPPGAHRDPAVLHQTIAEHGVTVMHFVPSMLRAFLASEDMAACPSLRLVVCSGEALPLDLQQRFLQSGTRARLDNLYGPTEAAIDVSQWTCRTEADRTTVPIGRPIANTQLHVLDRYLSPVPVGVTGELYIGGAGLARGYHRRAGLTAERFVPDPLATGARLYRTGDLARRRSDGVLEYVGRIDDQVKIRGLRIELGEIEARLLEHKAVRGAAVAAVPGPAGPSLVGYVVATADDDAALVAELRRHLAACLPEYMVPARLVRLDDLPLSPNGKLDRRALPPPEIDTPPAHPAAVPATATERTLAAIWQDVLGCPVATSDNFFESGGHSLLATQIVSRARRRFQIELPLRSLFEAPVLADFARAIEEAPPQEGTTELRPLDATGPQPLSFAQERLWFFSQLAPGSAVYNIAGAARLRGSLGVDAIRRSFDQLVARHPILRTLFDQHDGEPRQFVVAAMPAAVLVEDLAHLPQAAREQAARERANAEAQHPFDLARGPLIRVKLLRLSAEDHILTLTLHHIAADGWSLRVLVEEFSLLYAANRDGEAPRLPEPPVQYGDFARWQRHRFAAGEMTRQLDYWRNRLGTDHTVLDLPADRPRAPGQLPHGVRQTCEIDKQLTARLRGFGRAHGLTLFMMLLASFSIVLRERTGQQLVRIGGDVANRNHPLLERVLGFFVNQVVLQVEVQEAASVRDLLEQCRTVVVEASEHQDLPFNRLVEALRPPRREGRSPFFSIKLLYQDHDDPLPQLPGVAVAPYEAGTHAAELDLIVSFTNAADTLRATFAWPRGLFEPTTVTDLFSQIRTVLAAIIEAPDASVGALIDQAATVRRQAEPTHLKERRAAASPRPRRLARGAALIRAAS